MKVWLVFFSFFFFFFFFFLLTFLFFSSINSLLLNNYRISQDKKGERGERSRDSSLFGVDEPFLEEMVGKITKFLSC